ncbi:MAG: ATP-binding protein, partial [Myxococcales bacterium]
ERPAAPVVARPAAPLRPVAPAPGPVAAPDPALRRPRGDLLMVLRARTGATSIYSASQRRMVPLHYP